MGVLLISPDLMIQSRVAAAASRLGVPAPRVVGGQEAAASEDLGACRLVLLDLASPGLDVRDLVAPLRQSLADGARIVAFGPHVQKAKLDAARDAGCDLVISRGQFDRGVDGILQQSAAEG